jgi:hypothetical protein
MDYELKLTEKHIIVVLQALGRQPFDTVIETVSEIQRQIAKQNGGEKPQPRHDRKALARP